MDIVGDDGLDAQLVSKSLQLRQDDLLLPDAVILELDIEVLAEHVLKAAGQLVRLLVPIMEQELGDVPADASGGADQPLPMLRKQIVIDPRLIVEAVDECFRGEAHQVLVADFILGQQDEMPVFPIHLRILEGVAPRRYVGLDPDDGLDPLLLAFPIEVDDAVHDPMVRDSHGGLPQGFSPGHQSGDAGRSVQQGVLGMYVQMREGNRHRLPPQVIEFSIAYPGHG